MTPSQALPEPLLPPLTSNELVIALIARVTGEPTPTVVERLLAEERCLGENVRRDLRQAGLTPHEWSDDLARFYQKTQAFVYETTVWNRAPLKLKMRRWIGGFLRRHNAAPLRILSFGDGLGFDSAYLAAAGHRVTYFEVSESCAEFARQVFRMNGVDVEEVLRQEDLAGRQFDAVLCLDVLEHVPSPPDVVGELDKRLEPGGLLITHSPFFFVSHHRVTHLAANRQYSGDLALYRRFGMQPLAAHFFWDPIVLEKSPNSGRRSVPGAAALGGWLLRAGRSFNHIHCLLAQRMSRADPKWGNELALLLESATHECLTP